MIGPIAQDSFFKNQRRAAISRHATQIGIDYVEVDATNKLLKLYFIPPEQAGKKARPALTTANLRIQSESGLSQSYIRAAGVKEAAGPDTGNMLEIRLEYNREAGSERGDLPIYTLDLLNVPHLDPFFAQVNFSLQAEEPSPLDPQAVPVTESEAQAAPEIDYLAKDYSSFRQLMLNRLSLLMPQWQERNPSDLNMALVEIMAYAADRASYYQDAVATEAYMSTARRRVSVRRHARLIDYAMHEGCNARLWVQVEVNSDTTLPAGSKLLTKVAGLPALLDAPMYQDAQIAGATVFETMEEQELREEQNQIDFYTWGARDFVLPEGSTSATLRGDLSTLIEGQILIFEEVRGPMTGDLADANPAHRHAVRLTAVKSNQDPLGSQLDGETTEITEISWHDEDALPFPLHISMNKSHTSAISVARGNMVLADHGQTIEEEALIPPMVPAAGRYRPALRRTNLTYAVPYSKRVAQKQSASAVFEQAPRQAMPAIIKLTSREREEWLAQPDLLDSDRFTRVFVVEMESDRRASLRFGNGIQGKQPAAGDHFKATYRVGNGSLGNVGREAIAHLFPKKTDEKTDLTGKVKKVCNLLPAQGGINPEPLSEVRLYAPTAFQTQKRCVTEEDYVAIVKSHPDVADASAMLRWTGSWYTAVVVVKRRDNRPVDVAFLKKIRIFLEAYRVAGYEITIHSPHFVSLDIALTIHVAKTHFASTVKQTLLETFSAVDLPNGQRGYFHPDNFTFNQPVYLSKIVAHAVKVPGVVWAKADRWRRWGRPPQGEKERGLISMTRLEIARVQNKSNAPQLGQMVFNMEGGR